MCIDHGRLCANQPPVIGRAHDLRQLMNPLQDDQAAVYAQPGTREHARCARLCQSWTRSVCAGTHAHGPSGTHAACAEIGPVVGARSGRKPLVLGCRGTRRWNLPFSADKLGIWRAQAQSPARPAMHRRSIARRRMNPALPCAPGSNASLWGPCHPATKPAAAGAVA